MIKEKICKGSGTAKGYGCGHKTNVRFRKYGLCQTCLKSWLIHTDEGQEKLYKLAVKSKKKVRAEKKAAKQQAKKDLLTANKYASKYVQPLINELARLIDHEQPCICLNKHVQHYDAGHFYSVGSNKTLAFNLHNIHRQSVHSNHNKSGDNIRYRNGLERVYGSRYVDFIDRLKQCPILNLSKHDVVNFHERLKVVAREVKQSEGYRYRTSEERLIMRNNINKELGLYPIGFSVYEIRPKQKN